LKTHEQYEELCALAASGQASPSDLQDLRSHLDSCPSCRSAAYDFNQISAQGLAQVAAHRLNCEIPKGMTARFIARARSEGVAMSRSKVAPLARATGIGRLAAFAACAAMLLFAGWITLGRRREATPISRLPSPLPASVMTGSQQIDQDSKEHNNKDADLQQQIASAQSQISSMRTIIREQRSGLDAAGIENHSLSSQLADAQQEISAIRSSETRLETRIAALESDLTKAKADKSTTDAVVALQEAELSKLQSQLQDQEAALALQEELAARGGDVRDLVVARNLHIIDVHDRDGEGQSQRAFGRIFYTEGKSLIFYAYDLADYRKHDAKISFCVWGQSLGSEKPIRSLGVLQTDDAKEGRWMLTFDDPRVLAQINSVFVTAESAKKSVKEPGGKKILFAFLGDKPNHP
jgi:hypothetical protein